MLRRPARERERFRTRLGLVTLCACAMDASDERGTAAVHVLICALVSLVGKAGDALSPALLSSRPFLLLLLNASDAHLALTASLCSDSIASALCWLALVVARRCGEDGCYYFLGRHHGSAVAGRLLGVDLQKAGESYQRASLLALFAFPTAPVCILAGAGGASVRMFFAADVCATLLRASALLLLTADSFSPAESVWSGLAFDVGDDERDEVGDDEGGEGGGERTGGLRGAKGAPGPSSSARASTSAPAPSAHAASGISGG